jgi:DNA polymerase III epsilon subunit-like protein
MAYNDELGDPIVIDLETVASPNVADLLDPVKAPANYKDPAKIAAYQSEKLAERIATAGLEADLCEIVAIGMHTPDLTSAMTRREWSEAGLIQALWIGIGNRRIIGFNSLNFDLPVLIRRSQLLGIRCPNVNLDRYRTPHVDLLEQLTFHGRLTMRSLRFYLRRFGIPHDDPVQGSDIAALVAQNCWDVIAEHVKADVLGTAQLAHRLGYLRPVTSHVPLLDQVF